MNPNVFQIVGISVRTSNANGQSKIDIPELYKKFLTINEIPNSIDTKMCIVYTDYESDYTGAYTTIIGHQVENLDNIPEGMIGKTFEICKFIPYLTTVSKVYQTWENIWNSNLNRLYTHDIEIYDGENVCIYVSLK